MLVSLTSRPEEQRSETLQKLARLAATTGAVAVDRMVQHRARPDPATVGRCREGGGDSGFNLFLARNPGR